MLLCNQLVSAQVVVDVIQAEINTDPVSLVNDVFITGSCKNVGNIRSSGEQETLGLFRDGENIIGLADGIILSTGDVRDAQGPNNFVETSTQFDRPSEDKDLADIATDKLFDVAVLEFDFIPVESEVTFKYVFASEEYCEFVGTDFNDVFGFFVSGPGIDGPYSDGAINVARLPESDEFVSINSVNHVNNRPLYVKNELRDDVGNCDIVFNPSQLDAIEYDGFTIPLLARFTVIPCETYHIRLVVGDVADDKLDSAIFLESNSFDLGEVPTVRAFVSDQSDDVAYENCLDGQFIFKRPGGTFNLNPMDINFEIDDISTAEEGVDYADIPRTITIPGGQDTVSLPIQTLLDGQDENLERLRLNLNLSINCECTGGSSATLYFSDALQPEILFEPIYACVDQTFTILPEVTRGVPPFSFRWEDNSSDMSLQTTIQAPTNFVVTVTDLCASEVIGSVDVNIQEMPSAKLSGEIDFCEGLDEVTLPITFNGYPPWSFAYQLDGAAPVFIDSIYDDNFEIPVTMPGTFNLVEFKDAACSGAASGMGVVNDVNIIVNTATKSPSCPSENDGEINIDVSSPNPPFDIEWTPMVGDLMNPKNLSAGIYKLNITDSKECLFADSIEIVNPTFITSDCINSTVYIPNIFSPNGDGVNDNFEIFLADGNTVLTISKVEISDRWGNVVYAAQREVPVWDGKLRGKELNLGVYYYKIQIDLNDNTTKLLQGTVTLIR